MIKKRSKNPQKKRSLSLKKQKDKPPNIGIFKKDNGAEVPELKGNYLSNLFDYAKEAAMREVWENKKPLDVINSLIEELPDQIQIISRDDPDPEKTTLSKLGCYLLSRLTDWQSFIDESSSDALTSEESIKCLMDEVRTKKFLQGIKEVVDNLQDKKEEIKVCDAGCGAVPVLSIYAALLNKNVHCQALELNPNSARVAEEIVKALQLEKQIEIIEVDATQFQSDSKFDLVVSETMHSGLCNEPIVQIMSNLTKQLNEGGIVLPSKITVEVAVVPAKELEEAPSHVIIQGKRYPYVEHDWQTIADYHPGYNLKGISFSLSLKGLDQGQYYVLVTSTVDIGNEHLDHYQSLITNPQALRNDQFDPQIFTVNEQSRVINVHYQPGNKLQKKADKLSFDEKGNYKITEN